MKLTRYLLLLVLVSSCTDHYESLNTPEDQLTTEDVTVELLGNAFAQSQYTGMMTWYQVSHNLYAGSYSQFYTIIHPDFGSGQFEEVGSWSNNTFTGFYTNTQWGAAANQLHFVENYTEEEGMEIENAIAKVWRVQIYHRLTDYWGPIIYSEFGNGETSVAYDSQEDIYYDFFETLDEAIAVLEENRGANAFGTNDLVYQGDVNKWILFANSLRLRLAIRLAYVEPNLARDQAEKAVAAGVITDNADNALLKSTRNNLNKLSTITAFSVEFVMSATMQSILVGYEDPRTSLYMQRCCGQFGGDGDYVGERTGLPADMRSSSLQHENSYVGSAWLPLEEGGDNLPDRLLEAAEVYFLRAEGAMRGWDMDGSEEELYNQGIRASLNARTEASATEIEDYITSTNTPVAPTAHDGGPDRFNSPPVTDIPVVYQLDADEEVRLEQIVTQKWLSLFPMNDWEAWTERRRTGYPRGYAIIESRNPDLSETDLMRRLTFVTDEISNNAQAVEQARDLLQGPDNNATRLWWDAKPINDYPTPTDPQ